MRQKRDKTKAKLLPTKHLEDKYVTELIKDANGETYGIRFFETKKVKVVKD
jgi:hypothetical protein